MKQENDPNTSSSRNSSSTAPRSSSTPKGENGEQKPKGTASPVQFPTLSLPKGGGLQRRFTLLFIFVYISCNPNALSPDDFLRWMAEHRAELTDSQQQDYITSTLTYLPSDWLAVNEISNQYPQQIAAAQKEYEGLELYRLRVAATSGQGDVLQLQAASTDEYYHRVEYFSFGLQNDLRLLVGPDTLPCRLFHFERNYGAAPYMDFMLGFDQKEGNNFDRTLIYDDRVYSGSTIQLTIPFKNINSIPNLQL